MTWAWMFFALLFAHALADYPLQGDFLARAKNETAPIDGVPWWQAMSAHCCIHAGFVALITGSLWLGVAEFVAHFVIDRDKCLGRIGFTADQVQHICCKALWALLAVIGPAS